jgi:hypothetical protein
VRNHVKLAGREPKGSRTLFTMDCALEIERQRKAGTSSAVRGLAVGSV